MGGQAFGSITSPSSSSSSSSSSVDSEATWGAGAHTYDSVTDSFTDTSGLARNARLGASVGADSGDPLVTTYDAVSVGRYIYLPGTTGNYLSLADSAAVSLVGDQSHEVIFSVPALPPASNITLASKFNGSGNNRSWRLDLKTDGKLNLFLSEDGIVTTGGTGASVTTSVTMASVAVGAVAGSIVKVRWDWRASDGRVQIWAALGAAGTYAQVGTDLTANIGSIFDGTAVVEISGSAAGTSQMAEMNFYGYTAYSDITQTNIVAHIDPTDSTVVAPYATFVESSTNGATVTIVRSSSGRKTTVVDVTGAVFGTDDYTATADAAPLNVAAAGSFTLVHGFRFQGAPSASQALIAKKADLTTGAGYALFLDSSGQLNGIIADGTTSTTVTSAALTSGLLYFVALVRDVANDQIKLVVNGTAGSPVSDTTTGSLTNTGELRVGRLSGAGTSYADMFWINSRFFSIALTTAQLVSLQSQLVLGSTSSNVPVVGTYAATTTTVYSTSIAGETQPRVSERVDGSRYLSDGSAAPVRIFAISPKVGGLITSGSQSMYEGYESGLNCGKGNNTGFGFRTLKNATGQSMTAVGNRVLMNAPSANENSGFGNGALQQLTSGGVNTGIGTQALNSMLTGNNNQAFGAESMSYATSGLDNVIVGYYANTGWEDVLSLQPTAPNSNRGVAVGNYCGHIDSTRTPRNNFVVVGYKARMDGDYAVAIGSTARALAAGAVAIGTDSGGTGASTSTANEIKLGTANHTVNIPGALKVAGNTVGITTIGSFILTPFDKSYSNVNFTTFTAVNGCAYNAYRTNSGAQNDEVVFLLPMLLTAGTWTMAFQYATIANGGIFTVSVSADASSWTDMGTVDTYTAGTVNFNRSELTALTVAAGVQYLRLKLATKNASSSSYFGRFSGMSGVRTGA